jgi:hypothetical protein
MARVAINTGSAANDGTGDSLRGAGGKINSNFVDLYNFLGDGTNLTPGWDIVSTGIVTTANVGIGTTIPRFDLEVGAVGSSSTSLYVNGEANATSFSGSASGLTSIPSSQLTGALPALDGSALTNVVGSGSGVVIQEEGSAVGTAGTIDFVGSAVTATFSGGIATVSISGGGIQGVVVQEEGSTVGTAGTIDFVGTGVTATFSGGIATVSISGGGGGGASSINDLSDARADNSGNLALGSQALQQFGTGSFTGLSNVAVGNAALYSNTSGLYNSAFGSDALRYNTSGAYNAAFGYYALHNCTEGNDNTAVGYHALKETTTGTGNVAVGKDALRVNGAASRNVAIGWESSYFTTANANTSVGYESLNQNRTGNYNTAIGNAALRQNYDGVQNTALGNAAGYGNTSGNYNVAIGYYALKENKTGNSNVAIGWEALENLENKSGCIAIGSRAGTASTSSQYFTAVGDSALADQTTANFNQAFGYQSLGKATTGGYNVAVGANAVYKLTTGNFNTGVGYNALYECTGSSTGNVALGYKAGAEMAEGDYNTFAGYQAGEKVTTGNGNVAVGRKALGVCTSGNNNVAVGEYSLNAASTGYQNTALGYNAGAAITTGYFNVAIGADAAKLSTTGNSNVSIGYQAAETLTTGSGNISIGYNAQPSSATASNEITIGDSTAKTLRIPGLNGNDGEVLSYDSSTSSIAFSDYTGDLSSAVTSRWDLGANGTNHYTFTGPGFSGATDDPTVFLQRGHTYEFVNGLNAHPFQIQLEYQNTTGTAYSSGVTNNGAQNGTIKFKVPMDAPNKLHYQCTSHVGMSGTIFIGPAQNVPVGQRQVVSSSTGSISANTSANISIPGFKSYGLLKIGIDHPAWVRLYVDSSSRTSDSSRLYTADPTPGSGLIAEVRTTTSGSSTFLMSPGVIGWNNDSTTSETIYARVTNNDSVSRDITVSLTVVKLEG